MLLNLFDFLLVVHYTLPSTNDLAKSDGVRKFIKALNLWEVISVQELLQCLFNPEYLIYRYIWGLDSDIIITIVIHNTVR